MFETSTVQAQARTATGRYSLLSVSVIAHTAILVGAVAVSIASVDFPAVAPKEYARAPIFATVQIPPPLGRPDGGKPPADNTVKPPAPQPPKEQTAPPIVPDDVPPADTPSNGDTPSSDGPFNPDGTVPGPVGVEWGTKDSPGALDAPPVFDAPIVPPPVEERIYQPHEVVAPVLISRAEPRYPAAFMKAGMSATVVVRCIIDRNGNVRNPEVIVPAQMAPFNAEVLNVLPRWRYKPATYAGRPVDSWLTLTVHFAIKR